MTLWSAQRSPLPGVGRQPFNKDPERFRGEARRLPTASVPCGLCMGRSAAALRTECWTVRDSPGAAHGLKGTEQTCFRASLPLPL